MKRLLILFLLVLSIVNATGQLPLTNTSSVYRTRASSSSYGDVFQAVYNAMATKPHDTLATKLNTMVEYLVDNNSTWDSIAVFYCFAVDDSVDAKLEWTAPTGSNTATLDGGITWTPYEGFLGNNSDGKVDLNWNPSTEGEGLFQQNAAGFGVYVMEDYNENEPAAALSTSCSIFPRSSGAIYGRINCAASDTWTVSESNGITILVRDNSTTKHAYRNTTDLGDKSRSSAAVANADFEVCSMSGIPNYGRYTVAFFIAGGQFSDNQVSTIVTALEKYMDSNGKGVIP